MTRNGPGIIRRSCCRTDLRVQCRHGKLHSESSGVER